MAQNNNLDLMKQISIFVSDVLTDEQRLITALRAAAGDAEAAGAHALALDIRLTADAYVTAGNILINKYKNKYGIVLEKKVS